jgi:protein-tyrosine phosphatase
VIASADVVREGNDLVLTWTGVSEVAIAVGPSPDEAEPVHVDLTSPGTARLPGLGTGGRHYLRLEAADGSALVVAERRLPLEGPVNFRDLGGYATPDGRRVRWGRLYRSDSLEHLTPADIEVLDELGVRLVCDLRRDEERATAPSRMQGHPDLRIEHLPIGGIAAETKDMAGRMMRGEIAEVSVETMAAAYLTILELHADSFGTVVAHAADPANLPMVVHCTAGKDRTGVASALLLAALGVDDDTILDDYELTTRYHSAAWAAAVRPQLEAAGIDFPKVETYFLAARPIMGATLAGLRARYGSVGDYLTGAAGLAPATVDSLRRFLLN